MNTGTAPPPAVQTTPDNLPTINTADHSAQSAPPEMKLTHSFVSTLGMQTSDDRCDDLVSANTRDNDEVCAVCREQSADIQASNITVCYDLMWGY